MPASCRATGASCCGLNVAEVPAAAGADRAMPGAPAPAGAGDRAPADVASLSPSAAGDAVPEGDTLLRTAAGLRPHLVGRTVTAARVRLPGPRADRLIGATVTDVEAHGKHLLIRLRLGPRAAQPPRDARLVAPLSARRALAAAAGAGPPRARGAGRRRRAASTRRPWTSSRRASSRSIPSSRASDPISSRETFDAAEVAACAAPRCSRAAADRTIAEGAARPAHRSPASATSTRTRSCSSSASTRSAASATLDDRDPGTADRDRPPAAARQPHDARQDDHDGTGDQGRAPARRAAVRGRRCGSTAAPAGPCRRCGTLDRGPQARRPAARRRTGAPAARRVLRIVQASVR